MGRTLIIAEKPSVATDLARVLAKAPDFERFQKHKSGNYFENEQAVITSAVGHLVEQKMPEGPNGKKLPWKWDVLPVIPKTFDLAPIEKSEDRLRLILRLARKKEIDLIVNACDAGREGELIFRYILEYGGIKKPVKRLWMQSMTDKAILEAWQNLRSDADMQALSAAAVSRSEADWLVGLNGTRALTLFNSRHGGFNTTPAGRVQTPTLAILAKRECEIRDFVADPYAEVHARFAVTSGDYEAKWIDIHFERNKAQPQKRAERIWDKAEASAIVERCQGKQGQIEESSKPVKQIAPQLYDLTTLQREAGSRFGFSAKRTLQLAQALYERHKLLTYPRTDSRYLPQDYLEKVVEVTTEIAGYDSSLALSEAMIAGAKKSLQQKQIRQHKRVFDDKKVSDHFAIIPTGKKPGKLNEDEAKLYQFVTARFLAAFFPHAEYEDTTRLTKIHTDNKVDTFQTKGRVLKVAGWLEVYGRKPGVQTGAGKEALCAVNAAEQAQAESVELVDLETRPPARYTESTLLSAMEGAGKLVEDEELREAMSERGLGTPATRAATIEGLIRQGYLLRDEQSKRDLVVSPKGLALIAQLDEIGIEELKSPELTGDWEYQLKQIENSELSRGEFMEGIKAMTASLVKRTSEYTEELKSRVFPQLNIACPRCENTAFQQSDAFIECSQEGCGLRVKKFVAGKQLLEEQLKELIEQGFVGPLSGFKNRFGKEFDAGLELNEEGKTNFVFEGEREDKNEDLSQATVVGTMKNSKGEEVEIFQTERAWRVPGVVTSQDTDGLRISRTILQREIPLQQGLQLLQQGKTDLIGGFISKKGRKFSAYLTLDLTSGKLGFEFEPRAAKKTAAKKSTTKKAASAKKSAAKKSSSKKSD